MCGRFTLISTDGKRERVNMRENGGAKQRENPGAQLPRQK
jgi:hypothetical protein